MEGAHLDLFPLRLLCLRQAQARGWESLTWNENLELWISLSWDSY